MTLSISPNANVGVKNLTIGKQWTNHFCPVDFIFMVCFMKSKIKTQVIKKKDEDSGSVEEKVFMFPRLQLKNSSIDQDKLNSSQSIEICGNCICLKSSILRTSPLSKFLYCLDNEQ